MTPKEKAQKLVNKFLQANEGHFYQVMEAEDLDAAKECALVAVEFARSEFDNHCCAEINTKGTPQEHFDSIKQEIEKL